MRGREKEEKSNIVKSVMKALLIMEELDRAGKLSLGELSARLHMDKATVHRLVNTMKEAGYINQNPVSKEYTNSLKLLAMGSRAMQENGVEQTARPYVKELAEQTSETVNLGIMAGHEVIYIDKLESTFTIKVGLDIGTSVPCYCSGLGKIMLACTEQEKLLKILNSVTFEAYTDQTITNKEQLLQELAVSRQRGYSLDNEEYVVGLICFGAPILNYHGEPAAAISISCPQYRYDEKRHKLLYAELVMDAARKISAQLGYKA